MQNECGRHILFYFSGTNDRYKKSAIVKHSQACETSESAMIDTRIFTSYLAHVHLVLHSH